MSLLLLEGYDDGLYPTRFGIANGAVSPSYGKHGNGMRVGDNTAQYTRLDKATYTSDTTFTVGCWARVTIAGGGYIIHSFVSAGSYTDWAVVLDTSGNRLGLVYNGGSTWAAPQTAFLNTWYYIEVKVTQADGTGGALELRQDGVTILNLTGIDTVRNNSPYIYFGGSVNESVDEAHIDDIYFTDTAGTDITGFLGAGPIEVVTLLPNGNGNSSVMVGSDADSTDNYLLVDNNASAPPATTEYVGSATEGDKDTYAMEDLADTPVVYGVVTSIYAAKTDVDAKFMRSVLRSGTTDYVGTSKVLSNGTYANIEDAWDVDPDTAVQWLYGGVNAMQVGQEVRDS